VTDGTALEIRDNGLAESQDGLGLEDRSGKSEQHRGFKGHRAGTNENGEEMDVKALVDADVDVDMENMEQTSMYRELSWHWHPLSIADSPRSGD
jgi:hypothetical protein